MKKRSYLILAFCFQQTLLFSQAQDSIKVLFIYGSKPKPGYNTPDNPKWFGGINGGHIGIQVGEDSVLYFHPTKYHPTCHIWSHPKVHYRSIFEIKTVDQSWQIFPPHHYVIDSLKRAVIVIPVSAEQKRKLDSIVKAYEHDPSYDYATLGMRCASSTYEILVQIGILAPYINPHHHFLWYKIRIPRILRAKLFKLQSLNQDVWRKYIYNTPFTNRKWEHDKK